MSFLNQIFGPSKEIMWKEFSELVGGEFTKGGFFKKDKVEVSYNEWIITLDTYTVSTGKSSTTYTRMRAPYINADNFRFEIYRKNIFSSLGKIFGMQDVEIGDTDFDENFIIRGNDEYKIKMLLSNPVIKFLIEQQPSIYFSVKDDESWFIKKFPEGVDELYFTVRGIIKDVQRLKDLYDLFSETLNFLCHIGSAYQNDPNIKL